MCKTLTCDTYAKISVRGKDAGSCTGIKSYHGFDSSHIDLESMGQLIADADESVRAEPSDNT